MAKKLRTFIGFVVAGGLATIINYGFFASLYSMGINYLAASAIGYVSGIAVSFTINKLFVFTDSTSQRGQCLRYIGIYLTALGLQLALLEVGVWAGLDPLTANAIALIIVVIGNYFFIKRFVFSNAPPFKPH
jgi:putative flippase GtrA